jgi:hypothetical protein
MALTEVLFEKGQDPLPGILGGCGVIPAARLVEKGVFRAGINLDVVGNLVAIQFYTEFLS